MPQTKNKKLKL